MPLRVQTEQCFQQIRSAHDPHDLAIRDDRQPFDSMSMHQVDYLFDWRIDTYRNGTSGHDVYNAPVVQLPCRDLPAWLREKRIQPPPTRPVMLPQKAMLGNESYQSAILIHDRKPADAMLDQHLGCLSQGCIGSNCCGPLGHNVACFHHKSSLLARCLSGKQDRNANCEI